MTKMGVTAVLLCCLLTTIASAGDSYICISDMSTGFKYNKALDKWEIANFIVDENKYIVRRSTDKNIAWKVKRFEQNSDLALCKEDFNKYGFLFCELNNIFKMNKFNLRFVNIHPLGYYNSSSKDNQNTLLYKDGSTTPYIEIGKCSSIDTPP